MPATRLACFAGAMLLWAACILVAILSLQVVQHEDYARLARIQQERLVTLRPPRGSIFDRNLQPLAMSVPLESVSVNPLQVPDLAVASQLLSRLLNLDHATLSGRLEWALSKRRGFLWIKRKILPEEAGRLKSLKLDWIQFQTESQRNYPKGRLAAHLLGSVDHEEKGNAGLELALDPDLRGRPGAERLLTDVRRRGIESLSAQEPRPGVAVVLTIDERIQFVAEQALEQAVVESGAHTGSAVVMNPHNGDILALASYPGYDPNQPPNRGEDRANRFNHPVSVPFEPGSVFKVITLAAALETTNLRPGTMINCGSGSITLYGRTIHEAKRGFGVIPMSMVLAKSSNVGAVQIGVRVGQERLYEYVRRFGFGQRTGISLPAESAGMVRRLSRWGKTSLPSVAMGHEVGATALQLARACSVVANGGLLVKPRLILKKGGEETPPDPGRRAIRPETAIVMRQMMEGVVLHGTGTRAKVEGYSSGGKTGSAQIFDFATHRYTHTYNASFIGFAPVGNPAIVVVVTLNGTQGVSGFGGAAAAPVFKIVAGEALRVLDIPKDLPDTLVADAAQPELEEGARTDLVDQAPPLLEDEDEPAAAGALSPAPIPGATVPDFTGKPMRAVIAEASAQGLAVLVQGSGLARVQAPPPGSALQEGRPIRVFFAR